MNRQANILVMFFSFALSEPKLPLIVVKQPNKKQKIEENLQYRQNHHFHKIYRN